MFKDYINGRKWLNSEHKFAGYVKDVVLNIGHNDLTPIITEHNIDNGKVYEIRDVLAVEQVNCIKHSIASFPRVKVGVDGNALKYKEGDTVSSTRLSFISEMLAEYVYKRLGIPQRVFSYNTPTDHENCQWEHVGVSPYIRIVEYCGDGQLVPHYDGCSKIDSDCKTLQTLLVYMTNNTGGCTQFLEDFSEVATRKEGFESNVILSIKPEKGKVLLFDQKMLHTTSPLNNESKSLILTSLCFNKKL